MSSSSSRALYKRYLEVVQRWPLDPNKESRDVAVQVRAHLSKRFPKAELTTLDSSEQTSVRNEIEALERIVNNVNKNEHNCEYSTASGLTIEQLRRATATESVNRLNEWHDAGIINRAKHRLFSMFR